MKREQFLFICVLVFSLHNTYAQSSCRTPNQETGRCIHIRQCPILYDAVLTKDQEVVRFLRESQCGNDGGPLVCCGSTAAFTPDVPSPTIANRRPDLLPEDCGQQEENRILNGQVTHPTEFPWTAQLGYRNSSGYEQFSCGATLINDRYVLTAAHCVTGRILRAVGALHRVRLGEWNTDTNPDCFGGQNQVCTDKPQDFGVEQSIAHREYVDGSRDRLHDIALVRMNGQAKYTIYVRAVCLPQPGATVAVGQRLTVVGWGKTETGKYSPLKLKLNVPVVDGPNCNRVFNRAGVSVRANQLCAGGEKSKDSCSGDSGGPLLAEINERFYIEGIVSFGAECGTEGWPGIYTRVSKYRDWIEGNIRP